MQPGFKIQRARNQAIKPVHSVALTVWLAKAAVADSELTKKRFSALMGYRRAQERDPVNHIVPGASLYAVVCFLVVRVPFGVSMTIGWLAPFSTRGTRNDPPEV